MHSDITRVLDSKESKIFICGCGATGRLSLQLEAIFRQEIRENFISKDEDEKKTLENKIVSLMAGGDVALIKSVEDF